MSQSLPLLPLRDIVVFPGMIVPLFVGRDKSVVALEKAMENDKEIVLIAQLDPAEDDPGRDDLYEMGVTATIMQLLKLPDGTVRVLVEGKQRVALEDIDERDGYCAAQVNFPEEAPSEGKDVQALMRSVVDQFDNYSKLNRKLPAETAVQLSEIDDASTLADAIAGNINIKVADKQALLIEMRYHEAPGNGVRLHGGRAGRAAGRKEDPRPREAPDGKDPARILSQRADEGDPARAGTATARMATSWPS